MAPAVALIHGWLKLGEAARGALLGPVDKGSVRLRLSRGGRKPSAPICNVSIPRKTPCGKAGNPLHHSVDWASGVSPGFTLSAPIVIHFPTVGSPLDFGYLRVA